MILTHHCRECGKHVDADGHCPEHPSAIVDTIASAERSRSIRYVTGLDGWGDGEPSEAEQASLCAYVVHRLEAAYPGSTVTADVDANALTSSVRSDDGSIDTDAVRAFVGNEVWSDWCGGERAPGEGGAP